ncbi:MAG TPA: bifunctional enoyl-CoA hydratase/phosphate acetyltransferase [Candidatus Binataceae bacterium]|nr:bifunctional enoyl-CoA hydratase/phosphate acetyltransferase [Candidatus Binataceae bacterium]
MTRKHIYRCPPHLLADNPGRRPPTAVVGANVNVVLESARLATDHGLMEPVFVGDPNVIRRIAHSMQWDIADYRVVEADDDVAAAEKSVAMARNGEVKVLMKGYLHTDVLIRAVLDRRMGLRTGQRLSHVYYMSLADIDREMIITDSGVNIAPDVEVKLDIVLNAVALAHALDCQRPRVALLSATEEPTERMPSSVEAVEVTRRIQRMGIACDIQGPLALDNAVAGGAAVLKKIDGPVAGNADVLVVHNIETGNALSKVMVHLMGATAAGLVLGARVPLIVTSRTDPPEASLAAAAIVARLIARPAAIAE